jgi:hypothetical protein
MRLPDPRRSERMIMPIPFAWSLADGLPRSSRQKHDRSGYMAYVIMFKDVASPDFSQPVGAAGSLAIEGGLG